MLKAPFFMEALILVDIQNDFVPGGALAVEDGDQIIPVVNQLQYHFDLIVATKDWHPADHGSFAATHLGKKVGEHMDLHGLDQILWPVHCVQGTFGSDFVSDLDTMRIRKVFFKGTDPAIDSYSGFFDNGHKKATGLGNYLKNQGVKKVYIAGLSIDYCVNFTAQDALSLGFETYVITDACRAVNLAPGDGDKALEHLRSLGVHLINSQTLIGEGKLKLPYVPVRHLDLFPEGKLAITLLRLCHELIENYGDFDHTVILGLQPRGIYLSQRIVETLGTLVPGLELDYGELDITFFRDDFRRRDTPLQATRTKIDFLIENMRVILVDDVLFTGRTVRAALDAMLAYGRPTSVELLVLVDRKRSRQLPIEPTYVGITVDTIEAERIEVRLKESGGEDKVLLVPYQED